MGNGKGKANTNSEKTNTDKKEENRRTQTVKEIGKREKVTRKKQRGKGTGRPKGDYQENRGKRVLTRQDVGTRERLERDWTHARRMHQ